MHQLPRVARHLFCEDGTQAVETGQDTRVFSRVAGGEAGASPSPPESLAKRIYRVKTRGKACTMISMEDITEAEALEFVRGKWCDAEIES